MEIKNLNPMRYNEIPLKGTDDSPSVPLFSGDIFCFLPVHHKSFYVQLLLQYKWEFNKYLHGCLFP